MTKTNPDIFNYPTIFLKTLEFRAKHSLTVRKNKRKYAEFTRFILSYGTHPKAPVKFLIYEGIFTMARGNNTDFVNCNLSQSDEKPLTEFMAKYKNDISKVLEDLLNDGYTLKVGWYPDSEAFASFLQPKQDNRTNRNKILSSWSDDVLECIFMTAYKHFVLFDAGDWEGAEPKARWG